MSDQLGRAGGAELNAGLVVMAALRTLHPTIPISNMGLRKKPEFLTPTIVRQRQTAVKHTVHHLLVPVSPGVVQAFAGGLVLPG